MNKWLPATEIDPKKPLSVTEYTFGLLAIISPIIGILCVGFIVSTAHASEMPSATAEASFHSAKVERGMAENKEPVFGVEANVEWYGVSVGGCGCWDATNSNERRGKVNERCVFAGYERDICEHLTAGVGYDYKKAVDYSTHEVSGRVSAPFDVATPYAECVCDVCACECACYCVVGACRCFRPCECVEIECDCGIGCGNTRRNKADFERDACGLRDVRVGVSVNYRVLEHLSICPFCRVHHNLTKMARDEYNNGLVLDAGIALLTHF